MRRGFSTVLVVGMMLAVAMAAMNTSVLAKPGEDQISISDPVTAAVDKEWTFMVYLDGDNSLEADAFMNLAEMESVGSTDKVNMVVLMDTLLTFPGQTHWFYIEGAAEEVEHMNITTLMVECDCDMFVDDEAERCVELNMGDGKTLTDFIVTVISTFPDSDYYVLDLWDHGGGWRGVCWDEWSLLSDGRIDRLTTAETGDAIEEAYDILFEELEVEYKISILAYDACLNGVIDVVYENRDLADYMVASMTLIPAWGMDYTGMLTRLVNDPSMTPEAFGIIMVDLFVEKYSYCAGNGMGSWCGDVGLELIDMSKVTKLGNDMIALCDAIYPDYVDDYRFRGAIESSESQTPQPIDKHEQTSYTDMGLFATLLAEKIPELSTLAGNVAADVDEAVVYCRYVQTETGAAIRTTGISLYFTACYYYVWLDYAYDLDTPAPSTEIVYFGHDFTNYSLWDEILMEFVMAITPGEPTVPIA
jgi:hypothetical protein